MNTKKILIITIGAIVLIGTIGAIIFGLQKNNTEPGQTSPSTTDTPQSQKSTLKDIKTPALSSQLHKQIADKLGSEPNSPVQSFDVEKIEQPLSDWYIVSVVPKVDGQPSQPAKVIMRKNTDGSTAIVAGPGTSFPASIDLPAEVRAAL